MNIQILHICGLILVAIGAVVIGWLIPIPKLQKPVVFANKTRYFINNSGLLYRFKDGEFCWCGSNGKWNMDDFWNLKNIYYIFDEIYPFQAQKLFPNAFPKQIKDIDCDFCPNGIGARPNNS